MIEKEYAMVKLMGRCGNQFYQIATIIAYAKEYGFDYYVTREAINCENAVYFNHFPIRDNCNSNFNESNVLDGNRNPYYFKLPRIANTQFIGFWQSFKYFDTYRQDVLDAFKIPYERKDGIVSIHIRRGDYLVEANFPPLPINYYVKAIKYFSSKEYHKFFVFSDDIEWCKTVFNTNYFVDEIFEFSEGKKELDDLSLMSSCEHNIVANSSFSFSASWLNQNPDKIVICPSEKNMFVGVNNDMIPANYIRVTGIN